MGNCCGKKEIPPSFYFDKYELKTLAQAMALKVYLEKMRIPAKIVETVRMRTFDSKIDEANDMINKKKFLNYIVVEDNMFARNCLNTLDTAVEGQFFEFFCALHNFCTFTRKQLVAFTFKTLDRKRQDKLTVAELSVLVNSVYGTKVAKGESGAMITTNKTTQTTVKQVMTNLDTYHRGYVTLADFEHGLSKHANLLSPAYIAQQKLRESIGNKKMWEAEQIRFASHCNRHKLSPSQVYKDATATMPQPPNAALKASLKAKARVHPALRQESSLESDSSSSSSEGSEGSEKNTTDMAMESFGSSLVDGSMSPEKV